MSTIVWSEKELWFNRLCTNPLMLETPSDLIQVEGSCGTVCVNPSPRANPICAYHTCGPVTWPAYFTLDFTDKATEAGGASSESLAIVQNTSCGATPTTITRTYSTTFANVQNMGLISMQRYDEESCEWFGGSVVENYQRWAVHFRSNNFNAVPCVSDCEYLFEHNQIPVNPWDYDKESEGGYEDSCIQWSRSYTGYQWKVTIGQGSSGNQLKITLELYRKPQYWFEYLQPDVGNHPLICCGRHEKRLQYPWSMNVNTWCSNFGWYPWSGKLVGYVLNNTCNTTGPWTLTKNYSYPELDGLYPACDGSYPVFPSTVELNGTDYVPEEGGTGTGAGEGGKIIIWSEDERWFNPMCTNQLHSVTTPNSILVAECPDVCVHPELIGSGSA